MLYSIEAWLFSYWINEFKASADLGRGNDVYLSAHVRAQFNEAETGSLSIVERVRFFFTESMSVVVSDPTARVYLAVEERPLLLDAAGLMLTESDNAVALVAERIVLRQTEAGATVEDGVLFARYFLSENISVIVAALHGVRLLQAEGATSAVVETVAARLVSSDLAGGLEGLVESLPEFSDVGDMQETFASVAESTGVFDTFMLTVAPTMEIV